MRMKFYVMLLCALLLPLVAACTPANNNQGQGRPPKQANGSDQARSASALPVTPTEDRGGEGANASTAATEGKVDACLLLTSDDIEAVQGEAIKETRRSEQAGDSVFVSQCFFSTNTFTNSVSLAVTQKGSDKAGGGKGQSPLDIWNEQFRRKAERGVGRDSEKDRERGKAPSAGREEEEEEGQGPQRVAGVGDDAYWIGGPKIGALYVLKGDKFMRLSIGGPDDPETKIRRMKQLAQRAIKRL